MDKKKVISRIKSFTAIVKAIAVVVVFTQFGVGFVIPAMHPERNYYYYLALVLLLAGIGGLAALLGFDFKLRRFVEELEEDKELLCKD